MGDTMRVLFDTEEYVTTLKDGGVPDNYAHAMSRGLSRAFNQGVATSEDIVNLSVRIDILDAKIDGVEKNIRTDLASQINILRTESVAQTESLRTELTSQINILRTESVAQTEVLRTESVAQTESLRTELTSQINILRTESVAQTESLRTELTAHGNGIRTELMAQIRIQKMWMMIIAGLVALTNPVIMHLYKVLGLFH